MISCEEVVSIESANGPRMNWDAADIVKNLVGAISRPNNDKIMTISQNMRILSRVIASAIQLNTPSRRYIKVCAPVAQLDRATDF